MPRASRLAAASTEAFPSVFPCASNPRRISIVSGPLFNRRTLASTPRARAKHPKSNPQLIRSITTIMASPSPNAVVDKTPTTAPSGQTVSVAPDPASGAKELGRIVRECARNAIAERGHFALVLSGGSLVDALASSLDDDAENDKDKVEGSKWHAFWADERLVAGDSPDSNFGGAKTFLEKAGIPKENIHALADPPAPSPHDAAQEYESRLRGLSREVLPVAVVAAADDDDDKSDKKSPPSSLSSSSTMPVFDLVLLGVGPDGHVASLFPGLPAVEIPESEGRWVVGVEGSPKPPPLRISLTLPAINAAKETLVVSFGAGKAAIVREALCSSGDDRAPLPVQRVKGARWLIDAAAAEGLEGGK